MINKVKRVVIGLKLKNKQRAINKQYEKEGLTDEVLDAQVELNKLRTKHDIADSSKKINGKYVQ